MQWNQVSCSMACRVARQAAARLERATLGECPGCGERRPLTHQAQGHGFCGERKCAARVRASLYHYGSPKQKHPIRLRPAALTCPICQAVFAPKRYDQRCCSIPCNNRWQSQYGTKSRSWRTQALARRRKRWEAIGCCALCQTPTAGLVPMSALGGRRKNAAALYHRDHILPRNAGGGDEPENLRWLCWFCNSARQDMDAAHDAMIAAAGSAFWEAYRVGR